jgi:hypothetical protein
MKVDLKCKLSGSNSSYIVKWQHIRNDAKLGNMTVCSIFAGDPDSINQYVLHKGEALCISGDQYSKDTGRKISMNRAIKAFPKDVRAAFWAAYEEQIGFKGDSRKADADKRLMDSMFLGLCAIIFAYEEATKNNQPLSSLSGPIEIARKIGLRKEG